MQKGWSALRVSVLSSPTHRPGRALPRTGCSSAAEEAMTSSETNLISFSQVLYTNFQFFGNIRKEQSDIYQVIDPPEQNSWLCH